MQCIICKNDDQPANLMAVKLSANDKGYGHRRCIDQHNKTVDKNLRGLDASWIATEIFDHDLDATDPYVVKEFLRRQKPKGLLGDRWPTVNEIATAACEKRQREQQQWIFERIEEEIKHEPGKTEATETFITEIADDLKQFVRKDESACHFAARMLTLQVAWRKAGEAFDASYDEYLKSEENAD